MYELGMKLDVLRAVIHASSRHRTPAVQDEPVAITNRNTKTPPDGVLDR